MVNNLDLLRKLTLGTNEVKEVKLTVDEEEYPFKIRPLSDGELTELKAIEQSAFEMKLKLGKNGKKIKSEEEILQDQEANIDTAEFTKAKSKTKYTAIAYALTVDEDAVITVEDVAGLPSGVPDLLFKEIIDLSGLEDSNLTTVKQFLGN